MTEFDPGAEFDRQRDNLVALGYPPILDLTELRKAAVAGGGTRPPSRSWLPFALVTTQALIPADQSIAKTTLAGKAKPGKVDRNYADGELAQFVPRKDVEIPTGTAYLVFDVERGEEFRNVRPEEAAATIFDRNRSPITVDEGIAVITHFPEVLEKNNCFMLAGSRASSRKVPALWISEGAPKLGWCWDGNPHTWLGTASTGRREGI